MKGDETGRTPELFRKSALQGKEIWYIVAPASVPLDSLKEVSLRDINKGKAVVSLKNDEYGFVEETEKAGNPAGIIAPDRSGSYAIGTASHILI